MTLFPSCSFVLLLVFLPVCGAVCTICFGKGIGCPATGSANCPWSLQPVKNAAIVAATTGSLVAATLFPPKIFKLFPRHALDTIMALVSRPAAGQPFDCSGKSQAEVKKAVLGGQLDKTEAILHLSGLIDDLDLSKPEDVNKMKQLQSAIDTIKAVTPRISTASSTDGSVLYVLAVLSAEYCGVTKTSASLEVCLPVDEETQPKASNFQSVLKRPKSSEQMFKLLNAFSLVVCNLGLAQSLALHPFLEECIYEPVADGTLEWFVAFELMVCYLRLIQEHSATYGLANVISSSGGMDHKRIEARQQALQFYPSAIFRSLGGIPGTSMDTKNNKKPVVNSFDDKASKCCISWNKGTDHLAKNVVNGKCKFFHGCSQPVSDKGIGGQCRSTKHTQANCDYDPAKKLDSLLK